MPIIEDKIGINAFANRYSDNYGFYYDNDSISAIYREEYHNTEAFEELSDDDNTSEDAKHFRLALCEFVAYRNDFISSDRECASFYKTCQEFGIIE